MKNADPNRNLILGRKPTFGDTEQIAYVQKMSKINSLTEKHGGPINKNDIKRFRNIVYSEDFECSEFYFKCRVCKIEFCCQTDDPCINKEEAIKEYFSSQCECLKCGTKYKTINEKVMITHVGSND